jgi:hypothetical protein
MEIELIGVVGLGPAGIWVVVIAVVIVIGLIIALGWAIDKLREERNRVAWLKNRQGNRIAELERAYNDEKVGRLAAQEAYTGLLRQNEVLTERLIEIAARPPHQIDPTPIIDSLRRVFVPDPIDDSNTNPNSRSPILSTDLITAANPTHDSDKIFLPDVEMDEWIADQGFPTRGGWINKETNSQTLPPDGTTPVHAVVDGRLTRVDGQPMFRAGDGLKQTPEGGLEE